MQSVLIVIHLMIVVALVVTVLLQRSEGGALGIGGGGGGGFMTGRGQANVLTRATAILAALFFATSLGLTILAKLNQAPSSILQRIEPAKPAGTAPVPAPGGNLLDQLKKIEEQGQSRPVPPPPK
jgi:preprotein translocase subunit SecG